MEIWGISVAFFFISHITILDFGYYQTTFIDKQAFFAILGKLGNLAVVVAIVTFVFGENVKCFQYLDNFFKEKYWNVAKK